MSISAERSNLILDAHGEPMRRAAAYGETAWNGAAHSGDMRGWEPPIGSADTDNMFDVVEIQAKSRDLDRNEALARRYFDTATNGAIGAGLMPVPRPDWCVLGKSRHANGCDGWKAVDPLSRELMAKADHA